MKRQQTVQAVASHQHVPPRGATFFPVSGLSLSGGCSFPGPLRQQPPQSAGGKSHRVFRIESAPRGVHRSLIKTGHHQSEDGMILRGLSQTGQKIAVTIKSGQRVGTGGGVRILFSRGAAAAEIRIVFLREQRQPVARLQRPGRIPLKQNIGQGKILPHIHQHHFPLEQGFAFILMRGRSLPHRIIQRPHGKTLSFPRANIPPQSDARTGKGEYLIHKTAARKNHAVAQHPAVARRQTGLLPGPDPVCGQTRLVQQQPGFLLRFAGNPASLPVLRKQRISGEYRSGYFHAGKGIAFPHGFHGPHPFPHRSLDIPRGRPRQKHCKFRVPAASGLSLPWQNRTQRVSHTGEQALRKGMAAASLNTAQARHAQNHKSKRGMPGLLPVRSGFPRLFRRPFLKDRRGLVGRVIQCLSVLHFGCEGTTYSTDFPGYPLQKGIPRDEPGKRVAARPLVLRDIVQAQLHDGGNMRQKALRRIEFNAAQQKHPQKDTPAPQGKKQTGFSADPDRRRHLFRAGKVEGMRFKLQNAGHVAAQKLLICQYVAFCQRVLCRSGTCLRHARNITSFPSSEKPEQAGSEYRLKGADIRSILPFIMKAPL